MCYKFVMPLESGELPILPLIPILPITPPGFKNSAIRIDFFVTLRYFHQIYDCSQLF